GLAVPGDAPADRLVALRQGAGADIGLVAEHDDEVGIDAHHRQVARAGTLENLLVTLDRRVPAPRAGVEDELRLLGRLEEAEAEPIADRVVARRPDMEATPAERPMKGIGALLQGEPGGFARRHDLVIERARNADLRGALDDIDGTTRRVGKETDALAR